MGVPRKGRGSRGGGHQGRVEEAEGGTKEGARQQRLGEAVWRPWPEQAWRTAVMAVGERSGLKNDFRLILGLNRGRGPTGTSGVQMGSTPLREKRIP